jgi:hypothetical protein
MHRRSRWQKQAISLRSVAGPGKQTPQVAELYSAGLVNGGVTIRKAIDEATLPIPD